MLINKKDSSIEVKVSLNVPAKDSRHIYFVTEDPTTSTVLAPEGKVSLIFPLRICAIVRSIRSQFKPI